MNEYCKNCGVEMSNENVEPELWPWVWGYLRVDPRWTCGSGATIGAKQAIEEVLIPEIESHKHALEGYYGADYEARGIRPDSPDALKGIVTYRRYYVPTRSFLVYDVITGEFDEYPDSEATPSQSIRAQELRHAFKKECFDMDEYLRKIVKLPEHSV